MQKLRIKSWPTAAVVMTGIVGTVVVLVFAPEHALEAASGLGGLVIGGLLDRLFGKKEPADAQS